MNLTALDFMATWPYFDVTKYPNGSSVVLTREIFTDPMGTCDDSGNIVLPTPGATQRPTVVSAWSGDFFNSVQLTYPEGSGPGGVTQTKRMGPDGGFNRVYNISVENPIIQAITTYGDIVNSIQFLFNDGTTTPVLGGVNGFGSNHNTAGYLYEALSSIHINGMSDFYGCADCVVYGFQYWQPPSATLNAIRSMYVTSPKERSAADFVKAFPKIQMPADLITEELTTARKAHWDAMKARAKASLVHA
jgi:hypothetical protein